MKRISAWIVTPDGLSVGAAGLVLSGAVTSGSYYWWTGNVLLLAAGVVGVLGTATLLAAFGRAAWQRTLRPRWWPVILPAYVSGLLFGLIVAPFAALDIEAGVFMTLLIGPVLLVVLAWIALWTTVTAIRAGRRRRVAGRDDRSIVVTAA